MTRVEKREEGWEEGVTYGRMEREMGTLSLSWIRSFMSQALGRGETCGESKRWGTQLILPKFEKRPSSSSVPLFDLEFINSLRNMHSMAFRAGSLVQLRT